MFFLSNLKTKRKKKEELRNKKNIENMKFCLDREFEGVMQHWGLSGHDWALECQAHLTGGRWEAHGFGVSPFLPDASSISHSQDDDEEHGAQKVLPRIS